MAPRLIFLVIYKYKNTAHTSELTVLDKHKPIGALSDDPIAIHEETAIGKDKTDRQRERERERERERVICVMLSCHIES